MDTRRPVLVGIDGSDSALLAVCWGAAEAVRRHVGLRLVMAFEQTRAGTQGFGDVLLDRARLRLAEAVEVAVREAPGVVLEHELVVGHPISVLAAQARRAGLVVVGDRAGLGPPAGSVAVGLAVQAPGTVVIVRGTGRAPTETASLPVLVGVDGSTDDGAAAIAFAFEAATARHVSIVAVHTWSDLAVEPEIAPDRAAIEAAAASLLSERLDPWTRKYPDVTVEQVISRDHPARALLDQAVRAQLLVVGPGGRGAAAGLLLGSVCHAMVHRSPCPVAVVRPEAT